MATESTPPIAAMESSNKEGEERRPQQQQQKQQQQQGLAVPQLQVKLNIAYLTMGSRGDIQPHLQIARTLQKQGHRVRMVGSRRYRDLVEGAGLEFYDFGRSEPSEMIRRRHLARGEVQQLLPTIRAEFREMGERYWQACVGDPAGLVAAAGGEEGSDTTAAAAPFMADAIVASMATYAHSWIAARLGIPLHMVGTNPRSSTKFLPHSQHEGWAAGESRFKNKLSYWLRDVLFFQTMKDALSGLRTDVLGLEPFSPVWYVSQWNRQRVPFTNIWSPSLVPRCPDWGDHIDVGGYVFRDEDAAYDPPADLARFMEGEDEAGRKPIYVGFGSNVFVEPDKLLRDVVEGIRLSGARAVLALGWSGFDLAALDKQGETQGDVDDKERGATAAARASLPPGIFVVDECPHEWLFPRCAAVVMHGGMGTTSMALRTGRPTLVCPVAGDMPFWAHRVRAAGCGPEPLPLRSLTPEDLASRIRELLGEPRYAAAAADMAARIAREEPGDVVFARRALGTFGDVYEGRGGGSKKDGGRCDVLPHKPATWETHDGARLCAAAAHVLSREGKVDARGLKLLAPARTPDFASPGDPLSGLVLALGQIGSNVARDVRGLRGSSVARNSSNKPASEVATGTTAAAAAGEEAKEGEKSDVAQSAARERDHRTPRGTGMSLPVFLLFLALHLCKAPLILLHYLCFGLYNVVDFAAYELGSRTRPDLFASNPWAYSYGVMLLLLLAKPGKELASIAQRPFLLFPLALLRCLLAVVNVPIGALAITLRAADIGCARVMGERGGSGSSGVDVVREAKLRFGAEEAEHLRVVAAEAGEDLWAEILRGWENRTTGKLQQ